MTRSSVPSILLRASGITGKQATIAALNFAYVMLLAQAEYSETGGKMNVLRFPLPAPPLG
jgi:hypothetical protein